ncbi:MAG: TonB-dependent receptor plug domain-containing protein, partial [Moraxellaceae bacterium]
MRNRILPGVLFFLCAPLVMAADETGLPFDNTDELPMVLSATRLKQSLFDAPASVTVIDRQMIEQSGVREIPELLRLVPGMVVGYESSSEAFVSYHG